MRALVIGHAYVAEDNRAKWKWLGQSHQCEIELHLPHCWPSWEHEYRPTPSSQEGFKIHIGHAFRTGKEDQHFFAPRIFHGIRDGSFDILHVEQGASAFSYSQALFERNLRSPKTKTCFFTWINYEYQLRWPWTQLEPYNLRNSDGAIGGNKDAVDILRRHGFKGKTAVIPQLGVDPEFYSPSSVDGLVEAVTGSTPPSTADLKSKLDLKGVVIGFVGRLVEEKGIRLLLDAAQNIHSEITVLLLGSGPLEKDLLKYKDRIHLVHIPAVSHDEVRDYLRMMDMLVLPSFATPTWKEQFGHVLIEAMACEVPVIGSSSAAIPEVIGEAGLIFKEKCEKELFERMNLLVHSSDERKRFGQLGRQRVLERFTHEKIAEQTLEFWKAL
jgi:L-malate glycosyltransferase